MIEIERTFLAKKIPEGLKNCEHKEIIDIYIPKDWPGHAPIRIRKFGNKYEITKKSPIDRDHSKLHEQNISLEEGEFKEFMKLDGKKAHKIRYYLKYNGLTAEVDVFQGDLKGLVVVEFEFPDEKTRDAFEMPDFCLADVTQDDFVAGGLLCGKRYEDLEKDLNRYKYKKLFMG
jgi:CYTH domain-containing protein